MKWAVVLVALCCSGCIRFDRGDTTHQVILGFGIVSTPRQDENKARAIKTQYLGVMGSQAPGAKFGIGYGSSMTVIVPTNANVVVEVSDGPFQPVRVDTQ